MTETIVRVLERLDEEGYFATLEHPGFIYIEDPNCPDRHFAFGTANPLMAARFCRPTRSTCSSRDHRRSKA
jgi:hypothetical protein